MSDRIRMAESDRPPEETTEPQPPPSPPPPEPEQPPTRREGPEPEPPPKTAEETEKEEPLPPHLQARVNREVREKWELRRQVEQAQQQMREMQQAYQQWQQAQGQGAQGVNTDAEQRAFQRYQQQAAEERFNEACNNVYQRGKQEYADFDDAVRALVDVGAGQRPDFLSAVAQLPDGHRVYRQLAADLDNAGRIMRLPPMQMAMELALLSGRGNGAATPAEPVRHSRAPAPLRPIGGTSRAPQRLENMSMADFIKQRDKEEAERRR